MKRSKMITIIAAITVLLAAGVAIAVWQITGTGSGAAKAGTAGNLTVAAGTATGDLYPGATDGDVYITVTNPNDYPVDLTTATIAGLVTPAECAVTVDTASVDLSGLDNIAPGGTVDVTLTDVLSMGAAAPNSCQGAALVVEGITVNANTATTP